MGCLLTGEGQKGTVFPSVGNTVVFRSLLMSFEQPGFHAEHHCLVQLLSDPNIIGKAALYDLSDHKQLLPSYLKKAAES
jgi:hypothetical protein